MAADLVICDGEGPIALAGVMGGGNSEVSSETTDILLESAYFNPVTIRRTSKRLGLHTDPHIALNVALMSTWSLWRLIVRLH